MHISLGASHWGAPLRLHAVLYAFPSVFHNLPCFTIDFNEIHKSEQGRVMRVRNIDPQRPHGFWSNGRNFYSFKTGPLAFEGGGISANGCECFSLSPLWIWKNYLGHDRWHKAVISSAAYSVRHVNRWIMLVCPDRWKNCVQPCWTFCTVHPSLFLW